MHKYFIHETSFEEDNVLMGEKTRIWHNSHIQVGDTIEVNCSLGQSVNISNNVTLGNSVKVHEGVFIEEFVFCGASCVFTDDLTPKARYPKNRKYYSTIIRHDATLGANCIIVGGHEIGHHATIAASAVGTNIAYGGSEYLNDIYKGLVEALGVDVAPIYGSDRAGDIKHSNADISKAKDLLGYDPDWSFERGIKAAIEWYEANL